MRLKLNQSSLDGVGAGAWEKHHKIPHLHTKEAEKFKNKKCVCLYVCLSQIAKPSQAQALAQLAGYS